MKNGRRLHTKLIGAVVAVVAVMISSCGLGPDDLPSPKGTIGDSYEITLDFASALNLPTGANIMMDGLRVGEVKSIKTTAEAVQVSARIKADTAIPSDVTATIRQDTVLGDTYIGIEHTKAGSSQPALEVGGHIPLDQTASPPQLEDTLSVLATFVNGGNIQNIERSIRKINEVMPQMADLQKLASTVAIDLGDLGKNTARIDGLLAGLDDTATTIDSKRDKITAMLSSEGVVYWDRLSRQVVRHIGTLLPSIGSIFAGGTWLVPMLNSVDGAISAVRSTGMDVLSDSEKISEFLHRSIVPFIENPSVDVESVRGPDGQHFKDIEKLLRMLGATR